ncbi:UNVERIFIED_CONTAM: hypothetical protein GTU68_045387 [Idotea baltica]|nr:hypothetical protein [Idotea baltica]
MLKPNVLLSVKGLTVGLNNDPTIKILSDVSLELGAGKVLGLIGEAGSGKTVLAKALIDGLAEPLQIESGEIHYGETDVLKMSSSELGSIRGNKIGFIGSNPAGALDPTIPVGDQIVEKLCSVNPSMSKQAATDRVLEVLTAVRIPSPEVRFHEYPFQFSGGMMQRVMIVDALVTNPEILIADNITQALDVTVAAQIIRLIHELKDEFNTAILFISHDMALVREVCHRVAVMYLGRIVELTDNATLFSNPAHPYSRALLSAVPTLLWMITPQI